MGLMSNAMKPLKDVPEFGAILETFSVNPILGVLAGFAVTVILQSSSASVAVLQGLAIAGAIEMESALPILFGQNIGTCVTAMLSSIGASVAAKRAAVVHLLFNLIGTSLFLIIIYGGGWILTGGEPGAANPFISFILGMADTVEGQIADVHIIFNITNTLLLLPFANYLVIIAKKIIKDKDESFEAGVKYIDERLLETPYIAVDNTMKEVVRMGRIAQKNCILAIDSIQKSDEKMVEEVFRIEQVINQLNRDITDYLVKLSAKKLTEGQNKTVTGLYHVINDIERIGDHADNLAELAQYKIENKLKFSDLAKGELENIKSIISDILEKALTALENEDFDSARAALELEDQIDDIEKELRINHILRLSNNLCVPASGVIFLDIISNLERVGDHCSNISLSVLDSEKK
jgi:phosphate:Na+ symporter